MLKEGLYATLSNCRRYDYHTDGISRAGLTQLQNDLKPGTMEPFLNPDPMRYKMSKIRGVAKTVITRLVLSLLCSAGAIFSPSAHADEGGVSFWLPGQYSSLAATPAEPGWSMPLIYYHSSTDASGSKNFAIGGSITAGLDVDIDLVLAVPTYVFTNPVFGGPRATQTLLSGIFIPPLLCDGIMAITIPWSTPCWVCPLAAMRLIAWPISAPITGRWMQAAATPTSTQKPGESSLRC